MKNDAPCYVEEHHVFPVSIFGKNNRTVCLTAREHYIAHALLALGFKNRYGKGEKWAKMAHAWDRMSQGNSFQEGYEPFSSVVYSLQRGESREACRIAGGIGGRVRSSLQKQSTEKLNSDREGRISSGRRGGLANTEKQKASRKRSRVPKGMPQKGAASQPKEAKSRGGKAGAKSTNSSLYVCLVTRRVSNPGNLTKIQRAAKVPTTERRRLTNDELERYDGLGTLAED